MYFLINFCSKQASRHDEHGVIGVCLMPRVFCLLIYDRLKRKKNWLGWNIKGSSLVIRELTN